MQSQYGKRIKVDTLMINSMETPYLELTEGATLEQLDSELDPHCLHTVRRQLLALARHAAYVNTALPTHNTEVVSRRGASRGEDGHGA